MMTLKQMMELKSGEAFRRDLERNESVLAARVADGYTHPFALYSGNEPDTMAARIRHLGFNAWASGSTVWAQIL